MIASLIFVAAFGEYPPIARGSTEAWGASFSMREKLSQAVEPGVDAHRSRERTNGRTSCHSGVGGDRVTVGIIRNAGQITLSR